MREHEGGGRSGSSLAALRHFSLEARFLVESRPVFVLNRGMATSVNPGTAPITMGGRLLGSLFFGVFLCAGLFFEVMIARQTVRDFATYRWTRAEASVTASTVIPPRDDEHDPSLSVHYTYSFGERTYEGDAITVSQRALEDASAYQKVEYFRPGTRVPCWVNPSVPAEAVLIRSHPASALLVLFPLIFVAAGAFGLWALWRRKTRENVRPLSSRANNPVTGLWAMAGGSVVFLLAGLAVTYALLVRPAFRVFAASSWTELPCEIVSSRVQCHSDSDGSTYRVDIVFRYSRSGRTFTSNRYDFSTGSTSGFAEKAAVVRRYPAGTQARCFVDPANPGSAVIERGFTPVMWFGLFPLLFVLAGAAGLFYSLKKIRAGGDPAPAFRQPAATTPAGLSPTTASPAELPPAASPRGKLFGMLFAAVFWNGIVSVFLVTLFRGEWGGTSWFLALFLTPFVAIGLGLIGAVVYRGMALFNARPGLRVSHGTVCPGGQIDVSWTLSGRTDRVQRLRLTFEGREEVTYRRGTNITTDKETFVVIPLADTTEPAAIRSGTVRLQIPANAVPSFATPNNKIVWCFRVRGEIPRWPDIDCEYVYTLVPHPLQK